MALAEQPSMNKVPLFVFQDGSYVASDFVERHNALTQETTISASQSKQFGTFSGQFSSGGAKYNRAAVGFEENDFKIVAPTLLTSNPLLGADSSGTNAYGVTVSVNGADGLSSIPTDGVKKVGDPLYNIGNDINDTPSVGIHTPGKTVENATTPGTNYMEFDLGSVQYVGALYIYFENNVAPATDGKFIFYKVKTSTDAITYGYKAGAEANTTLNELGYLKANGFPKPPIRETGDIVKTEVMINDNVRYIRIITDGNDDGASPTKTVGTTVDQRTGKIYNVELSNVAGARFAGTNHLNLRKVSDRSELSPAELANISVEFKDFGDSAYLKIINNNIFDVYIYSLELYGLWVLKASEVDALNGTIRVSKTDAASLYQPNTKKISNNMFQFADYAEAYADSLLLTHKHELLSFNIDNVPLDHNTKNMEIVKVSIPDISVADVKTLVRRKTYRLSKSDSKVSFNLQEDKNITA